jgi:hypothetical protein
MPRNREVMELCDFAEKVLGSKPKMSDLERRARNAEKVRRWRQKKRQEGNPFA